RGWWRHSAMCSASLRRGWRMSGRERTNTGGGRRRKCGAGWQTIRSAAMHKGMMKFHRIKESLAEDRLAGGTGKVPPLMLASDEGPPAAVLATAVKNGNAFGRMSGQLLAGVRRAFVGNY